MKRHVAYVCLLLITARSAQAAGNAAYLQTLLTQAKTKQLSRAPYWRRLLHFRRDILGRYQSDVDDLSFFSAPRGRRDPEAELEADLRGFLESAPGDPEQQSVQCRFPARYAWLKEQLAFDAAQLPEQPCPRFEQWNHSMDAESVSIIFASFYMNNPASMYGHTFLRLNGRGHGPSERLLDYTVNYAAEVNTNNGILFAVLGLTGGYRGRFSTMPYYMKVQEYNNLESRDLWEYRLRLSPEKIDRLMRHLWEMGNTTIAYFFLNRNCSYQILPLLEVADPSLDLSRPFVFKAVPTDALRKVLAQPGLVAEVTLRPSHVSKLLQERARLRPQEIREVERLAKTPSAETMKAMSSWPLKRQALVLDTAYDLFRYRVGFTREKIASTKEQERKLLLLRNQLAVQSPEKPEGEAATDAGRDAQQPLSPDHGHKTGRLGLSYGFSNHSHFEEFSARPAVHDQDDPPLGYIPGSQLQMFLLRLRYDNDRRTFYPEQFTLVDLTSFSPWDRWVHHPSWKVNTGLSVAHDLDRDPENSLYYGLNGASGFSAQIPKLERSMVYALAEADAGFGAVFRDGYRLGGGGTAGIALEPIANWRMHVEGSYLRYSAGEPGEAVRWRLIQNIPLAANFALRAKLERQNQYKEVLVSALWYL
jgi:hypothetical protein